MHLILKYFAKLTSQQKEKFEQLGSLYSDWNEKINVISRKDIDNLYERHVLHSLSIAKIIPFKKGTCVLDIGTGGGFPGIPLAILFPDTHFHLVDSIGKKIKVVQAVADTLKLDNVIAEHARAEKIKGEYDFVVSRAVTDLRTLYNWSRRKIKKQSKHVLKNGLLVLKGGDVDKERQGFPVKSRKYAISDFFEEEYFGEKWVVYVGID